MVALSERKIDIVRQLVETAPDPVVGALQSALSQTAPDSALADVRRLVETEAADRVLRNAVLLPIAPLCVGDGRDPGRLTFPRRVLWLLWRGLKTTSPGGVAAARAALKDYRPGALSNDPFDDLVLQANAALRCREPQAFDQVAELCAAAQAGGAERLAMCLELAPVVRRAIPKLPDWIAHADGETAAAARLAYKDCVAIAEDSGPCFFEMLAAQLPQPWMVLRIISAVMDRPSERYLAESEMVSFGQRVLDEIEGRLKAISNLDLDGGAAAAKAAAGEVELVTLQISEMETFIDLSREHGWGHEIGNCKKALAGIVEGHLRSLEKAVATALPTQQERISRLRHERPKLNLMPDPIAVRRALMLLAFAYETRTSANYGGFVAARTKVVERLGEQLDNYVAEVVDHIRTGDVEDDSVAYAFLEVAADMARLLRDEKAAELVRRRAAAVRNETSARPPRVRAS